MIILKYDGSFPGRQRRPTLNRVGLALKDDLLSRVEVSESHVIRLRIDFFHSSVLSYHNAGQS
jgi:hypothetical protein